MRESSSFRGPSTLPAFPACMRQRSPVCRRSSSMAGLLQLRLLLLAVLLCRVRAQYEYYSQYEKYEQQQDQQYQQQQQQYHQQQSTQHQQQYQQQQQQQQQYQQQHQQPPPHQQGVPKTQAELDSFLDTPKPGHMLEHVKKVPTLDSSSLQRMMKQRQIDYIMVYHFKNQPLAITFDIYWARLHTAMGDKGWKINCAQQAQVCQPFSHLFYSAGASGLKGNVPSFVKWNGSSFELFRGEPHLDALQEWLHRIPGGTDVMGIDAPPQPSVDGNLMTPQMHLDTEIRELIRLVQGASPNAMFVEWGTGGSTQYVATKLRGTQIYFAIEHNVAWYQQVQKGLPAFDKQAHVSLHHIAATISEFDFDERYLRPIGHSREEVPTGLEAYIHGDGCISELTGTPLDWDKVEGAFVDGLARGAVLMMLATNLRQGTTVLLHDYVGRESRYDWALRGYTKIKVVQSMLVLKVGSDNRNNSNKNIRTNGSNPPGMGQGWEHGEF